MATKVKTRKVDGEILVSLCIRCKCCLAGTGHCYTCHTSTSIANMCGCGECDGKADSFVELEAMRVQRRKVRYEYRSRARITRNGNDAAL